MGNYTAQDGDTWQSIAETHGVVPSWLILSNALDPGASPPPDPPAAGTVVNIPGDPPGHSVSPGNGNSVDLGPGGIETLRLRLHDSGAAPMTAVRYRVQVGGLSRQGVSADGWVDASYPAGQCATVHLEWGAPDDDSPHPYARDFSVDCASTDPTDQLTARLLNLGYDPAGGVDTAIVLFQYDYGVSDVGMNDDGTVPSATQTALDALFAVPCDATKPPSSSDGDDAPATEDPVPTSDDM